MAKDLIRYDLMVQDALRSVVRRVLTDAEKRGLPGEHHFFITFRTDEPGVKVSERSRAKYPEEMTIVLQHQYHGLRVTEDRFEVGLHFAGVPEQLSVPFAAVTGFFDPSVQFGLKFEPNDEDEGADDIEEKPARPSATPTLIAPAKADGKAAKAGGKSEAKAEKAPAADEKKPGEADGDAKVISFDSFRRK
ncbi:MAG: hypothetical protein KGI57_04605 [Hyphomicrobiales bacterium]|nr:hypothetical protein [Hyphomicrobiales bacterium]